MAQKNTLRINLGMVLIAFSLLLPAITAYAGHKIRRSGLTISSHHLAFNHKREGKDLKIQTGNQWHLKTEAAWISFSKLNGSSTATVQIKVLTNNSVSTRKGFVVVNAGGISDTLIIEQNGQPVTLIASPSNLQTGKQSQKFEVQVVANLPWQIEKYDSWIHIDQVKSDLFGKIMFTVEQTSGKARSGTISISAGEQIFDIVISQANVVTAEEDEVLRQLDIYPNPATDFIMIEGLINQYQLMDVTGKIHFEDKEIKENSIRVETGKLPKGMYFIRLNTPIGTGTQRIVIQ
jgi:hypothetical protein